MTHIFFYKRRGDLRERAVRGKVGSGLDHLDRDAARDCTCTARHSSVQWIHSCTTTRVATRRDDSKEDYPHFCDFFVTYDRDTSCLTGIMGSLLGSSTETELMTGTLENTNDSVEIHMSGHVEEWRCVYRVINYVLGSVSSDSVLDSSYVWKTFCS